MVDNGGGSDRGFEEQAGVASRAHPDEAKWRDMARDNAGVASGQSLLRYGVAAVSDQPCDVAVQVATVLLRNGWPGPPRPCSPTCPVTQVVEAFPGFSPGDLSP